MTRATSGAVRIALISDIHANLAALDAVLADVGFCLKMAQAVGLKRGDVIAFGHTRTGGNPAPTTAGSPQ